MNQDCQAGGDSESWSCPPGSAVKKLPAMQEMRVRSLGWEDSLEMTTHSSILAWRIPWTRSLADCSPWGCKELDTTERLSTQACMHSDGNVLPCLYCSPPTPSPLMIIIDKKM